VLWFIKPRDGLELGQLQGVGDLDRLPKVVISWNPVSCLLSEALELLRANLFSPSTFNFSPQLLNKLGSPRFADFADFLHEDNTSFDVPIRERCSRWRRRARPPLSHSRS